MFVFVIVDKMTDINVLCTKFNKKTKQIVKIVRALNPDDQDMFHIQKRIRQGCQVDPLILLKLVGPYLWKHRKAIGPVGNTVNEKHFLKLDFRGYASKEVNLPKLVKTLRTGWETFDHEEKDEIKLKIQKMLRDYAEYRLLTKNKSN